MSRPNRRSAVAGSRLFDELEPNAVDDVLAAATSRELVREQHLFHQAERADAFFLIERGYLKLTQVTPDGAEVIVRFVGPWDPVAAVTAVGEAPYPVTATACDAVHVLSWPRSRLLELLRNIPNSRQTSSVK